MTFCVFPVYSVAILDKCFDSCAYGHHYFRSGCSASAVVGALGASTAVDRKSMGHTLTERSCKTPTFCVIPVISAAVMEKCCDACGDGGYYFRSRFSASADVSVLKA
jgi:hypothetical protein